MWILPDSLEEGNRRVKGGSAEEGPWGALPLGKVFDQGPLQRERTPGRRSAPWRKQRNQKPGPPTFPRNPPWFLFPFRNLPRGSAPRFTPLGEIQNLGPSQAPGKGPPRAPPQRLAEKRGLEQSGPRAPGSSEVAEDPESLVCWVGDDGVWKASPPNFPVPPHSSSTRPTHGQLPPLWARKKRSEPSPPESPGSPQTPTVTRGRRTEAPGSPRLRLSPPGAQTQPPHLRAPSPR
ncbi:basic salivary proline-rich protein 1-like [Meriones unguiculatus]|uniref:basic salivary proline-rich protein 1-like n=1 Tax=Meriones unguiculatus TaxID=10047 RepID=UPI000B4FBF77|nr:basic salivary proline-rich protein 1-like [Meriones unguiculatus]